jgi:hypothetical protein
MNKEIEALDTLMDAMTEEDQISALDNKFPYLFSKASTYLKIGPGNIGKRIFLKSHLWI